MSLAPGTRLGAYELLALTGAGGMGEVYKARDTRLDRIVAIKISQEQFSERFEREARAIATLNHPHICTLHDVGPNYLVMEYIDGTPLKGPLPIDQALRYAGQIADALDAAHKKHIIHRDLKPANILVTKTGVKLLDFGLAKADVGRALSAGGDGVADLKGPAYVPPNLTALATEAPLTAQGTILGTLQYMSPEQLQGRDADARSDIFSFGLVLYEMLTGKRAFEGSSPASVIGAILERPAPIIEPEPLNRGVNRLIATCLAKDPDDRFQTARDLKRAIEWTAASITSGNEPATPAPRTSRIWIGWAAAAICAALALIGWLRPQPAVNPAADLAVTIAPPSASGIAPVGSELAIPEISPDGAFVTYHDRFDMLQLRRLNAISPEPLPGASGVLNMAIWSADSKSLVFADGKTLKKMRVPDGAPEIIARLPGPLLSGSLSDSGIFLFLSFTTKASLFVLPPAAREPREIEVPGLSAGSSQGPKFLPGSEDFLFGFTPQGLVENELYLVKLRDGKPADPALLMKNATGYRYTPAGGGRVLFCRGDNLYAQALNRMTRKLEGNPELVERGVATGGPTAYFSVSRTGAVAWRPGRMALPQVTIFDRHGKPIGTAGPPSVFLALKLSPDDRHVLVAVPGRAWLLEPNQLGLTNVSQGSLTMLWSPDSSRFLVPQGTKIVERPVSGPGEGRELANVSGLDRLEDVSADGKVVLFTHGSFADAVFAVRLDGASKERVATSVVDGRQTSELVWSTRFSPDGRWIVYQVPGQNGGIYAQPFPGPGLRKQVASGGEYPVWRKDGKEIVYLARDRIWSVRVDTSDGEFHAGTPEPLFSVRPSATRVRDVSQLAVSRDGSRIYFPQAVEQPDSDVIHVRMGWDSAAARRK